MSAEIRTVLKPLLNSKHYESSYLKSNLGCKMYLFKYEHCLQEPKVDKYSLNGQIFTVNRSRTSDFFELGVHFTTLVAF